MAQSSSSSTKSPRKQTGRRLNRSEQRAMEIRAAKSVNVLQRNGAATPAAPGAPHLVQPTTVQRPAAAQRSKSALGRGGARSAVLTRDQEYAFIHNDLRRMLILAAVLVVGMIAVLFVLESL